MPTLSDPVRACARRNFPGYNGLLYLMRSLRRRLASGALAVALLQCALLFAAPLSACCGKGDVRSHAAASKEGQATPVDCCPVGAHPPGQCPLHKKERSSDCAFRCGQAHAPDFVLGAVGILAAPPASLAPPTAAIVHDLAGPGIVVRVSRPDGPPPRSL